MRIAVVSDIHGNVSAFEAVLRDLRQTSPDLIFHGGDLTVSGSASAAIVDQIRDLGWQGVLGNTDQMLIQPQSLEDFAATRPSLDSMWTAIREIAAATREELGEDRLAWLRTLRASVSHGPLALVHASPASPWQAAAPAASDDELRSVFDPLGKAVTVHGHIHLPYIRDCGTILIVNTGSVSLSYDGDPRASYLLLDDSAPSIRRVEYSVDREVKALAASGLPHFEWIARTLKSASPQLP